MQSKSQSTQTLNETLPPFKDVIKVEIEVQSIFNKLLGEFPADYKHKEILAHAIVGSAQENGGLSFIYNALNGYTNDIDFKVGDRVICTEEDRVQWYDANKQSEDGTIVLHTDGPVPSAPKMLRRKIAINECEVIEIGLYKASKLKVRFKGGGYNFGPDTEQVEWVHHKNCTKTGINYSNVVFPG